MNKAELGQEVARETSSFRDPAGYVYRERGIIHRKVNPCYLESYELLKSSGLYASLTAQKLLLPWEEVENNSTTDSELRLRPEQVDFISYPYEWCFSQLKDAALLTLKIQALALEHGLTLRDASAYNIQFHNGRMVHIDSLSFAAYEKDAPWSAYQQFCRHFLLPLALRNYCSASLRPLQAMYIDGLPLELARLLPKRTWFDFGLVSHLHLHARMQARSAERSETTSRTQKPKARVSKYALRGLIDNLRSTIQRLKAPEPNSAWQRYYEENNYDSRAMKEKTSYVEKVLERLKPESLWDMGANTGRFSMIAARSGARTLAFDVDEHCIEALYAGRTELKESAPLPLCIDLSNPSPSIGWSNQERLSLAQRGPVDCGLALALIHHLVLACGVPLERVAEYFSRLFTTLVIEFVPVEDSQAQRLLQTRGTGPLDAPPPYSEKSFRDSFSKFFEFEDSIRLSGSSRTLYTLRKRQA